MKRMNLRLTLTILASVIFVTILYFGYPIVRGWLSTRETKGLPPPPATIKPVDQPGPPVDTSGKPTPLQLLVQQEAEKKARVDAAKKQAEADAEAETKAKAEAETAAKAKADAVAKAKLDPKAEVKIIRGVPPPQPAAANIVGSSIPSRMSAVAPQEAPFKVYPPTGTIQLAGGCIQTGTEIECFMQVRNLGETVQDFYPTMLKALDQGRETYTQRGNDSFLFGKDRNQEEIAANGKWYPFKIFVHNTLPLTTESPVITLDFPYRWNLSYGNHAYLPDLPVDQKQLD